MKPVFPQVIFHVFLLFHTRERKIFKIFLEKTTKNDMKHTSVMTYHNNNRETDGIRTRIIHAKVSPYIFVILILLLYLHYYCLISSNKAWREDNKRRMKDQKAFFHRVSVCVSSFVSLYFFL